MSKVLSCYIILSLLFINCSNKNVPVNTAENKESLGYHSDYFVFIADDSGEPLVLPIDINWTNYQNSYDVEYKSWYGTSDDWPIRYFKNSIPSSIEDIPDESFEHTDMDNFRFNSENRSVAVSIDGAPSFSMSVPEKREWTLGMEESEFPTYAFRTTVRVGGENRTGWVVYERIRFLEFGDFDGFEAFYWMPMVVDGNLYHFTQHRDEQTAVRWLIEDGDVKSETVPNFTFKVVETISDAKSRRKEIPHVVQLQVPSWNIDITMTSTGAQVGYGEEYPKGLAYFRQSLLESTTSSSYGMMELILGNN